jgi:hypothetical protein
MKINAVPVQAELVSGTNIVTINGSSLLGSGNIVVGGGGGGGAHAFVAPNPSGGFSNGMVNVFVYNNGFTTKVETANRLTSYPFIPFQTIISTALVVRCAFGVSGALGRILIYSNLLGYPNTKLYESADIDLSTSGDKTVLTAFTFTAGTTYWLAFHSSSNPTMGASQFSNMIPVFSNSSQTYNSYWQGYSFSSGSPTTFSPTTYDISNVTNISIKL